MDNPILFASVKLTTDKLTDLELCSVYNFMTARWPLTKCHPLCEQVKVLFTEPGGLAHTDVVKIVGQLVLQRPAVTSCLDPRENHP